MSEPTTTEAPAAVEELPRIVIVIGAPSTNIFSAAAKLAGAARLARTATAESDFLEVDKTAESQALTTEY